MKPFKWVGLRFRLMGLIWWNDDRLLQLLKADGELRSIKEYLGIIGRARQCTNCRQGGQTCQQRNSKNAEDYCARCLAASLLYLEK